MSITSHTHFSDMSQFVRIWRQDDAGWKSPPSHLTRTTSRLCPRQFRQVQRHRKHHRRELMGTTKPTGTEGDSLETKGYNDQTDTSRQVANFSSSTGSGFKSRPAHQSGQVRHSCIPTVTPTGRRHEDSNIFRIISNLKPVAIHIATCGFETVARHDSPATMHWRLSS
jgi:hypothetical protein